MKNLALVYFVSDKDKYPRDSGNVSAGIFSIFLKRIYLLSVLRKLKRFFRIRLVLDKRIEVDSNFAIQGVKLPYTLSELNKLGKMKRNSLDKAILKICTENSVDKCIIPAEVDCSLRSCVKSGFTGKIVYTVLAEKILRDICTKKRISISEVDIVVIQGEDDVLPYTIIKLLSPSVKFITLITSNKEMMEKKVEQVCDETGLSVRVTNDEESALRSCDFVINYGDIKSRSIKNIVNSNAVVINYGKLEETLTELKDRVVNGVEIGLGNKYFQGLKKEIFRFYNPIELAEILLVNKSDIAINNLCDLADYIIIEKFKSNFEEDGFFVKRYL